VAAAHKKPPKTSRRGAVIDTSGEEPTLVGRERAEDLSRQEVIFEREQRQRHRMQDRTILGLLILRGECLILGSLALIGVASGWFDASFAWKVLAITLTPSFTAWLIVVRWAFRRHGGSDRSSSWPERLDRPG
jgi:hypothetical protein